MFKWFGVVNFTPSTRVSEFATHLKEGRITASRCRACGARSFPPRADCDACMGGEFEWVEISGRCTLHTFTTIVAAPTGFERHAPYTVGVVDLEEGGRALAWLGDTVARDEIAIGMKLQLVPRIQEDAEELRVFYTLERPQTAWSKVAGMDAGVRGAKPAQPAAREGSGA
jgi:uncharacterized OB-fold protein